MRENIPGGKAVAVDLMNQVRAPKRATADHTGASGTNSVTP